MDVSYVPNESTESRITPKTYIPLLLIVTGIYFVLARIGATKKPDAPLLCAEISYKSRIQRWTADAESLLRISYAKFKAGQPMLRATIEDGTETILLNGRYLNELKSVPDDYLTFTAGIEHFFVKEYSSITNVSALGQHAIRSDLTPGLPRLMPKIAQEAEYALDKVLPCFKDVWTPVPVFQDLLDAVARVSARLFVGDQLCRSEKWIEISKNYTIISFKGAEAIKKWHPWMRPLVHRFLPELRELRRVRDETIQLLSKSVKQFSQLDQEKGSEEDNLLGWIIKKRPETIGDINYMVEMQLMMSLAAIHTTTMSLTHIVYDLAYRPEYIEPLREEIQSALEQCGGFNKEFMARIRKVDSFMKESQRTNPPAYTTFRRLLHKDIMLSDGTFLPKGNTVEIDVSQRYKDSEFWENPEEFNGMRFYRLREQKQHEKSSHQFASSNQDYLHWGQGKHACPGRFFATNEIKTLLAMILLKYDLALPEGTGRPNNVTFGIQVTPNPVAQVLFKKRETV